MKAIKDNIAKGRPESTAFFHRRGSDIESAEMKIGMQRSNYFTATLCFLRIVFYFSFSPPHFVKANVVSKKACTTVMISMD